MEVAATRRQRRDPVELEIALIIIIILSGVYVAYDMLGEPRGGHPFGHWLGIIDTRGFNRFQFKVRLSGRLRHGWSRHWGPRPRVGWESNMLWA